MSNLRDKYTDKEWLELEQKIETDRINGKPQDLFLNLSIWSRDIEKLKSLRLVLSEFYNEYELENLDNWIKWKCKFD